VGLETGVRQQFGLRVFLLAAKRLQARGGKISLCGLQDYIQQVFDLAGFSSILSIYASRDEALRASKVL
jgi:anti-anti-sigma factor